MYRLVYSNTNRIEAGFENKSIASFHQIRHESSLLAGVQIGNELIGLKYIKDTESWKASWRKVFETDGTSRENLEFLTNAHGSGDDFIALEDETGLLFYQVNDKGLELVANSESIDDLGEAASGKSIGRFYPKSDMLRVMTPISDHEMKFYFVNKQTASEQNPVPIWSLRKQLPQTSNFMSNGYALTKWHRSGPETIVLRSTNGLELYQFGENYELQRIAATSQMGKTKLPDLLLFAHLTGQPQQEVLHMNSSGIFIFQYDASQNDFKAIDHHLRFSQRSDDYIDAIQVVDLNLDKRDDLLFTDKDGISAMTYNAEMKTWESILDTSNLKEDEKHAKIVGVVTGSAEELQQPMIFTQNSKKELLWGKFVENPETSTVNNETPVEDICAKKRKKRQATTTELSELLLTNEVAFFNAFKLVLSRTPIIHASVSTDFFPNLIVGALTSRKVYPGVSINKVYLMNQELPFVYGERPGALKHVVAKKFLIFSESNRVQRINMKIFVSEPNFPVKENIKVTEAMRVAFENLVQANANKGLENFRKATQKIQQNTEISVELYFVVNSAEMLRRKTFRSVRANRAELSGAGNFEMLTISNDNLQSHLATFQSSNSKRQQMTAVEEFHKNLLQTYSRNLVALGPTKTGDRLESEFHAILYGALEMSFKNKFSLDVNVERIAGRGYSDVMFLFRKTVSGSENWLAVPVIVELKSTRNIKPDEAINQIKEKGYLYNLSMRTAADEAIIVGINSQTGLLKSEFASIPTYDGFIRHLMTSGLDDRQIKEKMKNFYFSTSPQALKFRENQSTSTANKSNTYTSRMILGEIMSTSEVKRFYVYPFERSFLVRVLLESQGGQWTLLNIFEDSNTQVAGTSTVPAAVPVSSVTQVDIRLDTSRTNSDDNSDKFETFFKGATVVRNKSVSRNGNGNLLNAKRFENGPSNFLKTRTMTEMQYGEKLMAHLNEIIESFDSFIDSESDFQAFLQGFFRGWQVTNKIVKIFPEANLSKQGRVDLIVSVLDVSGTGSQKRVSEDFVIAMELKYRSVGDVGEFLRTAESQLSGYSNFETVTDRSKMVAIAAVYDKSPPTVNNKKRILFTVKDNVADLASTLDSNKRPKISGGSRGKRSTFVSDSEEEDYDLELLSDEMEPQFIICGIPGDKSAGRPIPSGANKLSFWPAQVVKSAGLMIAASAKFFFGGPEKVLQNYEMDSVPILTRSTINAPKAEQSNPSLLQMGDQWLSNADVNGNLLWATLLARKFSSKSSVHHSYQPAMSEAELNILSLEIVETFMQSIMENAAEYESKVDLERILKEIDLVDLTRRILNELRKNNWNAPSELLYSTVSSSLKKLFAKDETKIVELINHTINKVVQQHLSASIDCKNNFASPIDPAASFCYPEGSKSKIGFEPPQLW